MDKKNTKEKLIPKTIDEIIKEAKRIEESTLYSSKSHFAAANYWTKFHYALGIPIIIMSAVAGTAAFSKLDDSGCIAGIISIIVAIISSLVTFINPNENSKTHFVAGNKYDDLNNQVRIFRTIDCLTKQSNLPLTEQLKLFSKRKTKLNTTSPKIPWFAYKLAKRGIENGEANFAVDEGDLKQK